jgi:hypothetical protein
VTISQACGARSGLQGMVSSDVGGANEANGSKGIVGNWVLGDAEKKAGRGKEDEQMKASTSSSPAPGRWAAGEQNRKREEEAVRHCGTVRLRGSRRDRVQGFFAPTPPVFFCVFFISTELG